MTAPSYASGRGGPALLGDTVGARLARTVQRFGSREALVDAVGGRRWTWAELGRDVDALAGGLLARGVLKGDRVALWAPGVAETVLVQLAAARAGAVLVSLNPAYGSHELAYALTQSGAGVLVAAPAFEGEDRRAVLARVGAACPALHEVLVLGTPEWEALPRHADHAGLGALAAREAELSCDDPAAILYTSGTTGTPKGAVLSHHNVLNNAYLTGALLGHTERDRVCLPVPLHHTFGMVLGVLGAVAHGACAVLPAPSFDPAATLRAVAGERCTSLFGVPTMFRAELNVPDLATYDLTSLRTGITGGSPCPPEVLKRVMSELHMADVAVAYGMTETSPVATLTRRGDDAERRAGTVGEVLPHVEVKVTDPVTGLTVPRGGRGELCVRGHGVMLGYWQEPERTSEVVDAARWMHTGDLAEMGEDGYVRIVGRIKDMIIRDGESISPREIEEFLYAHPKIADVQVVGVPDEAHGEEVVACVILADGAGDLTAEEVDGFCRGRLARFKIPRRVRVMAEFPLTSSGKIRKAVLREALTREPV
ncbi:AMP-binding protein [Streptomyces sp. B1866]|uniref:AMP-binding protein n=1 Tax=Streptomyces sp. B1866 TaxID=3075431 RepID=UPI0028927FFA|nr:AMP-binding protein [Streptomyces sp. B1866]MDT3400171.1 AMP-binding protein [Streptomyces sp. B1866]